MTKEEAIEYIKRRAGPEGVYREVLWYFLDACDARRGVVDYAREAYDACYEWDC